MEINRLKHEVNKDTDINDTSNFIDANIDEDINMRRKNGLMSNVLLMTLLIIRSLLASSFKISIRKLLTLI